MNKLLKEWVSGNVHYDGTDLDTALSEAIKEDREQEDKCVAELAIAKEWEKWLLNHGFKEDQIEIKREDTTVSIIVDGVSHHICILNYYRALRAIAEQTWNYIKHNLDDKTKRHIINQPFKIYGNYR